MNSIKLETKIKTTLESIWHAWTEDKSITQWFPPEANIEPKLGGFFELFFDPHNHNHQSTIGCVITSFEPKTQIAFTWKGPNQFANIMNDPSSLTRVIISFLEKLDYVLVKLEHMGWNTGKEWEEARTWHEEQWQIVLNDLKNFLESK